MTIAAAQLALAARDFGAAMRALAGGDHEGTPAWLELRAHAAYGNGDYEAAVTSWEQLHALHRSAGDRNAAAHAAAMTAMLLLIDAGLLSTVRGWVRRASRLLDGDEEEGTVHAMLAAVLTYERFLSGDLDASRRHADDAIRLGESLDVVSAVAIGRTANGRIAILRGDIDEGLGQLDEVAALLMSGEVDDLTTGIMFCELVCAAQALLRPDLAREWTQAMERWGVTAAFGAIRGRCRVHQAELLRQSGPSADAERVALQACEELRPWLRREYGWPLVELGLTRLRRGDLAGAEAAFSEAGEHCWPLHPGLALLRLEQGDVAVANELIQAAIAHPPDAPSKELPPFGDLRLAPLLDAQSEISLAAGDRAGTEAAARALAQVATVYRSPWLEAAAALATARHALLSDEPHTARSSAAAATAAFAAIESPYDVARSRVVCADALAAAGMTGAALEAIAAARADFARYGAINRVAELDARLAASPVAPPAARPAAPPAGRVGTFRREGPMWAVGLGGNTALVKNLKGLRFVHRLLAEPRREFHVLDLVAVEAGTLRASGAEAAGIPLLDDEARQSYRRRLADIDDDIDEASRHNDLGRLAKAEVDREYLLNELARGVGLAGRARRVSGSSERARTAVARTLRYALDELATHHAPAADHLRRSIRTGTYCTYAPDPAVAVQWTLR